MHIRGMMEHISLQRGQKMRLEEENIISMIMTEMEMLELKEMTEILEMIEMTKIGSKNHKGMNLRNQSKMLDKTWEIMQ